MYFDCPSISQVLVFDAVYMLEYFISTILAGVAATKSASNMAACVSFIPILKCLSCTSYPVAILICVTTKNKFVTDIKMPISNVTNPRCFVKIGCHCYHTIFL